MPDQQREQDVIGGFCRRMSALIRSAYTVESWPDQEAPGTGKCDAIIRHGESRWALDHTRLSSYPEQAKEESLHVSIAQPVARNLSALCGRQHVSVALSFRVLYHGRHDVLRVGLEQSLREAIPRVPDDGRLHPIELSAPRCEVHISRRDSPYPGCFISRVAPPGYEATLEDDFARALRDKSDQLHANRPVGGHTLLLLDTNDIALINEAVLVKGFQAAAAVTDHSKIDEVFVVDHPTGLEKHFVWPLKYRGVIPPDLSWFGEFHRAQGSLVWGFRDQGPPYIQFPPQENRT